MEKMPMWRKVLAVCAILLVGLTGCQRDKGIEGRWQGSLQIPQGQLRVVFHITKQSDGSYAATLDSPDQGASGIPIDTITFKDDTLHAESKRIGGTFDGKRSPDGGAIVGSWQQSGTALALTLKRQEEDTAK
jgi:hypothetical protein